MLAVDSVAPGAAAVARLLVGRGAALGLETSAGWTALHLVRTLCTAGSRSTELWSGIWLAGEWYLDGAAKSRVPSTLRPTPLSSCSPGC